LAPKTLRGIRKVMPFESQAIHVRWAARGSGCRWGDLDSGVSYENHTSIRAGPIIFSGGIS